MLNTTPMRRTALWPRLLSVLCLIASHVPRERNRYSRHNIIVSVLAFVGSVLWASSIAAQTNAANEACNETPDLKSIQYIVGYGSLMQDESRHRTAPEAGPAYPINVRGWRRGWFARGTGVGFDTTYLGIVAEQDSAFNAVIYQLKEPSELFATDQRESFYCRHQLSEADYTLLTDAAPVPRGQVWIYVPRATPTATAEYPIVQSYVDVFVSGCLEQEQRFHLNDFAKRCIETTTDWSPHWVNDRIYPRRAHLYQPKAGKIDRLLHDQVPQYFKAIRIESGSPQ